MLKTCLENKVIFDFLTHYDENCWHKLIPSLLEIAILNLKYSFNKLLYSEEDIHNIIKDLKINLKKNLNNNNENLKFKKLINQNIIFSKPPKEWRTSDGWDESDTFINNRYNHSLKKHHENNINKKWAQTVKSKIKGQVDLDKKKYYENINNINNRLSQSYNERERINYAISYDKDLKPEIIERTTIKKDKNKKGGKKIIQKMTQEEYEERYTDENQDNNEIYHEENEDDDFEKNEGQNQIKNNNNKQFNNINSKINTKNNINQKNLKKKNLYHYNINYIDSNNNNFMNNNDKLNNNYNNYINNNYYNYQKNDIDKIANTQKGFENKFFKNQIRQNNNNNIIINDEKINNINNENNTINENKNNNYYEGINGSINKLDYLINDTGKNVDLIKYKIKIDELEKNIMSNIDNSNKNNNIYDNINKYNNDFNKNNIDNYADKLKVNITNMEDYKMKKGIVNNNNNNDNKEENKKLEINIINNENNENNDNDNENDEDNNEEEAEEIEEEEKKEEENNLNDNESEGGDLLSQMSNMTEKGKSLFKRAMDEYPPIDEDNF